jgi:hypothetical protein
MCKTHKLFDGCANSAERIKRFVHEFIRSEYVSNWTAEKDSDFTNESDRASRCHDAAEFGADGKTHAEVIEDWRESFSAWIRDRRAWTEPERFIAAVEAHFDAVEAWHEKNGSLFQEIG